MKKLHTIRNRIIHAIQQRQPGDLPEAYRLFNGFYEGLPGLVLDRYGPALVIFEHSHPGEHKKIIKEISRWVLENIPGLSAVLLKQRQHSDDRMKNGILISGDSLPVSTNEFGVNYVLDLQMNQDAGFYLDTRRLRRWLKENMSGKRVLNTFAYTGSLGVAAGVGGAREVLQTDINEKFLTIAEESWRLNALPEGRCTLLAGDFFRVMGRLRHQDRLFDCVILDPPFFSATEAGRVDLQAGSTRLINKVRPLIAHQGWLVVINNAIYLSGEAFMAEVTTLCQSKYLQMEKTIPVPPDITGYPETIVDVPPVDPAPFNHPTKIVTFKVFRKDERQKG
ncbi:MAG: class I SAM-dependent methyltransferase [Brevefilum sp.]